MRVQLAVLAWGAALTLTVVDAAVTGSWLAGVAAAFVLLSAMGLGVKE